MTLILTAALVGGAIATLAAADIVADQTMEGAAKAFLASLRPEQAARAELPFNSEERLNWFFVPRERLGLPLKDMDAAQSEAALQLLRVSTSQTGFRKVATIRQLETVLREMESGRGPTRDPDLYYVTIFGEPSHDGVWGWRFEGHHVSLNWTIIRGKPIASTPQFLGSNPATVHDGPMKGTRVLAAEEDLARALVRLLTPEERAEAVLSETAPPDIITSNQRIAAIQEDRGIRYSSLNPEQQGVLLHLIREQAAAQRPEIARSRLDAIRKAGLDGVRFAWMGGLEPGQGHYYRIQGATFLIEFDCTQDHANHIHSVWRDFKGDWGLDLLAEHYRRFPHSPDGHSH